MIDLAKHEVVANWPIAPGEEATGLAIDLKNHRLFIGASNKLMLMMDSTNGKIVAQVPIGAGVDATWFDPETEYAFTSSRRRHDDDRARGFAGQADGRPDAQDRPGRADDGARSGDASHLPGDRGIPAAAGRRGAGRGRATMVPNSMKILVFGLNGK